MRHACEGARAHMLRRPQRPPSLTALYTLSAQATHEAVHLLCQMLVFDPVRWLSESPAFVFWPFCCSRRTSVSRWWTRWRILILTRAASATTRACASAATPRQQASGSTLPTSNRPPPCPSTTFGKRTSNPCSKLKVNRPMDFIDELKLLSMSLSFYNCGRVC